MAAAVLLLSNNRLGRRGKRKENRGNVHVGQGHAASHSTCVEVGSNTSPTTTDYMAFRAARLFRSLRNSGQAELLRKWAKVSALSHRLPKSLVLADDKTCELDQAPASHQ